MSVALLRSGSAGEGASHRRSGAVATKHHGECDHGSFRDAASSSRAIHLSLDRVIGITTTVITGESVTSGKKGGQKKTSGIPNNGAIMMDGNGPWASWKGNRRVLGHKAGMESVRDVVEAAGDLGVKVLTLYAFSKENWSRPRSEVLALMALLQKYTLLEKEELRE